MPDVNSEFIDRYLDLLDKDPKSRVFAPLAEAYRKLGMTEEALDLCQSGLKNHPKFSSGMVVHAKVLMDLKKYEESAEILKEAVNVSPENIMAHRLLAGAYFKLRKIREALSAYKMVLFLNPKDQEATEKVSKLEALSAKDFSDETFEIGPVKNVVQRLISKSQSSLATENKNEEKARRIERLTALADAYIVRNDNERAKEILSEAKARLGAHEEIQKRFNILDSRDLRKDTPVDSEAEQVESNNRNLTIEKINVLKQLLTKFEAQKKIPIS